jgi:hypothetical protein
MKLILSGEGPTDLGTVQLVAGKWEFVPGPMAWIVDKILEVNYTAYSLLEFHQAGGNCVIYVCKSKLNSCRKVESMRRGFASQEYLTGVPMVPNPKSEAWMICALRNPLYTNCASLEDQSGNDNSPNSLKDQLKALCGGSHPSAETQANWVKNGKVDPGRIDMPSFSVFKQDLHRAAQNAGL